MSCLRISKLTNLIPVKLEKFLLMALIFAIAAVFLVIKLSVPTYDKAHYYPDTASYAATADQPLSSVGFWAGERSFTLPLFFKLIGINSLNYKTPEAMAVVAYWQLWISFICWSLLGLALAFSMRCRLAGLAAFGICLVFASNYEIIGWDLLLLSESLSFSLFALLLASWILMLSLFSRQSSRLARISSLVGSTFITVLYTFVRDSNVYFAVIAAAVFLSAGLLYKSLRTMRLYSLAYLGCTLALLVAQNVSISVGNRWQIFIYDHLAYRIIPDKQALAYFVQAGLPVNEQLLQIPNMRQRVYKDLILHNPEMAAARQWIDVHGKATYLSFLLAQPVNTLAAPLLDAVDVLDGTSSGYRVPLYKNAKPPRILRGLTRVMFPTGPAWMYAVAWLVLMGISLFGILYDRQRPVWLAIAVLLISMYPLMLLVWHGNPMEIPRHADQVAIQFRLAGWMLVALGLDWVFSTQL